jgi:hypothetical protein
VRNMKKLGLSMAGVDQDAINKIKSQAQGEADLKAQIANAREQEDEDAARSLEQQLAQLEAAQQESRASERAAKTAAAQSSLAGKMGAMKADQVDEQRRQAKVAKEMEALEMACKDKAPKQVYQSIYAVMNRRHDQESKELAAKQTLNKVKEVSAAVEALDAALKESGVDLEGEDANTQREAVRTDTGKAVDDESNQARVVLRERQIGEIKSAMFKMCPDDAGDILDKELGDELEKFEARLGEEKPKGGMASLFGGSQSSPRAASQKFLKKFAGGAAVRSPGTGGSVGAADQAAMMKSFQKQEEKQKEMLLTVKGMEAKLGKIDDLFAKLDSIEQLMTK